ncbi:MAG: Gfo/Idh/MocA family protein, partial [Planctomycetota bacterium]
LNRAKRHKDRFYPEARIYRHWREVIQSDDVDVVDLAAHPAERVEMITAALDAGKHVLSQKPFVLDLDVGRRMVELADEEGVKLAVNQNGRWAPHFSYVRQAVAAGLIGELSGAHFSVHWNHNIVKGTAFEEIEHLILYDFAIHWFDMLTCLVGGRSPNRVYASVTRSKTQRVKPPLLAQALVEYDGVQASLVFDGDTRLGPSDSTYVTGSRGTLSATGPDLRRQKVTLTTAKGIASPRLHGCWFDDGFHGTMGELLTAIEEDREPANGARENLRSLALCFAAVASAELHQPVAPGTVWRMPG